MERVLRLLVVTGVAALLTASVFGAAAGAAEKTQTYPFYDCTGPAGTPTSFDAVKTAVPEVTGHPVSAAAAFRLTDGSAIYTVLSFGEGNFSPPGITTSGNADVVCSIDFSIGTVQVAGLLAPRA